jgi:hypothetical protein
VRRLMSVAKTGKLDAPLDYDVMQTVRETVHEAPSHLDEQRTGCATLVLADQYRWASEECRWGWSYRR